MPSFWDSNGLKSHTKKIQEQHFHQRIKYRGFVSISQKNRAMHLLGSCNASIVTRHLDGCLAYPGRAVLKAPTSFWDRIEYYIARINVWDKMPMLIQA